MINLESNEARHLISQLTEYVFWSDDPLNPETIIENGILRKLIEEYPTEAESVREEREMDRLKHLEQMNKEREENE